MQAQQALKAAVEEARAAEARKQQEETRQALRAAHAQFTEQAKEDTARAVAAALELYRRRNQRVVESKAC